MLGAAFSPVFVTSSDIAGLVSPDAITMTLTAFEPAVPASLAIGYLDITLTVYDPDAISGGLVPPVSVITLEAPAPDILGSGDTVSATVSDLTLTAPAPTILVPFSLSPTPAGMTFTGLEPVVAYGYVASTGDPDFTGVPRESTNPKEHARQIAGVLNRMMQGKFNATATITLNANTTKTYWRDGRLSATSAVSFDPMTANASAEKAAGTLYVAETDRQSGQWLLTHANAATTDRRFRVKIIA